MSNFSLTFTLKQHTPLIHFHGHMGATLRATELKPKFDAWLIKAKGGEENVDIKRWTIKTDAETKHPALNYKVRIVPKQKPLVEKIGTDREWNIPQFFANMGNSEEYKKNPKFLSQDSLVEVVFTTFSPGLKDFIQAQFHSFLARTNFGSRQNKGFGSFFEDNSRIEGFLEGIPSLTFKIRDEEDSWKEVFHVVNYYYQRLKSGINYCFPKANFNHYQPSFLKIYFSENNPGKAWEKRWLKEQFLDLEENEDDKFFARALLGLPYTFQFIPKPSDCNPNKGKETYPDSKLEIDVKDPTGGIARIKSPLTFKPIINGNQAKIFILTDEYLQPTNHSFKFSSNGKTATLNTPLNPIDLNELLKEYHKHLGKSFMAYTFTGNPKYQITLNA